MTARTRAKARTSGGRNRVAKRTAAGRAESSPASASVASETPKETPTRTGRNGNQLRTGNPGNRGGGRPPSGLKEALAELRGDPKALKALKTAARNAKSKGFPVAWRLAERYDPDRPSEKHDVNLSIGLAAAMREADERLEHARRK